jgi:hypothetical protein
MIADRKFGLVQSNNIQVSRLSFLFPKCLSAFQDNANFEMVSHIEGPIVDSLYDMALISWNNKLEPPLPAINTPAAVGGVHTFKDSAHDLLFGLNGVLRGTDAIIHPQKIPKRQPYGSSGDLHTGPTSIEDATHPVAGGGQGNLTPKNEEASTVENPRQVQNPVGNESRGGDFSTGPSKIMVSLSEVLTAS